MDKSLNRGKQAKMNSLTQSFFQTASLEFQSIVTRLTEIIESFEERLACDVKRG